MVMVNDEDDEDEAEDEDDEADEDEEAEDEDDEEGGTDHQNARNSPRHVPSLLGPASREPKSR